MYPCALPTPVNDKKEIDFKVDYLRRVLVPVECEHPNRDITMHTHTHKKKKKKKKREKDQMYLSSKTQGKTRP